VLGNRNVHYVLLIATIVLEEGGVEERRRGLLLVTHAKGNRIKKEEEFVDFLSELRCRAIYSGRCTHPHAPPMFMAPHHFNIFFFSR